MKRVLLLDTSFAARPIHDTLLRENCEVWVIGNRPTDPLVVRDPTHYIEGDYSDVASTQAHIERLGITNVVPGCTDVSIETATRLRTSGTTLDSPETNNILADKSEFRDLCMRLDLPAPRIIRSESLPINRKLIAKPVDAFSGRGITVFDGANAREATEALEKARGESRSNRAIFETYSEGDLYSYSAFVEHQEIVDAVIVSEFGSVSPFAVDTSYVDSDFPAAGAAALKVAIERIARELGLVDGLIHVQFIWNGAEPSIVEITRRCPGDLYPTLIQLSTGAHYAKRYTSYFVGLDTSGPIPAQRFVLRHTVSAGHAPYDGFWPIEAMRLVEFHPLTGVGRKPLAKSRVDRVGVLFCEFGTRADLLVAYEQFSRRSAYRTQSHA